MTHEELSVVAEALTRCATMDDGWARQYRFDAAECEKSDSAAIRKRAEGLLKRASRYEDNARKYQQVLSSLP